MNFVRFSGIKLFAQGLRTKNLFSRIHKPSPEDSPALPRRPREQRSIATPETGPALALELPGAGGPRSPPSGTQSLLRMCACSCVCVFIRMSLFEKQPSLWGSWTLHVRVSPHRPPPLPPGPCPSPLLPGQPALLFPAEKRIVGNSRTLPTHPPAPACWGCLHASPEPGGTPSPVPFPLLTKEKKEFQTKKKKKKELIFKNSSVQQFPSIQKYTLRIV